MDRVSQWSKSNNQTIYRPCVVCGQSVNNPTRAWNRILIKFIPGALSSTDQIWFQLSTIYTIKLLYTHFWETMPVMLCQILSDPNTHDWFVVWNNSSADHCIFRPDPSLYRNWCWGPTVSPHWNSISCCHHHPIHKEVNALLLTHKQQRLHQTCCCVATNCTTHFSGCTWDLLEIIQEESKQGNKLLLSNNKEILKVMNLLICTTTDHEPN